MKLGFTAEIAGKWGKAAAAITIAAVVAAVALLFLEATSAYPNESLLAKAFEKAKDELNIFRTATPGNGFITEYSIVLSANDLNYFRSASEMSTKLGYRPEFASDYKRVQLEHEGKTYSVGMALYGDGIEHYRYNKKSFKIKAERDDFIDNGRRLDFILPRERMFYNTLFSAYLGEKLGLFMPDYEIALVYFNGTPQGLYLVREGWDSYFVERNQKPELLILERSENWWKDHPNTGTGFDFSSGVTYRTVHITPFDLEISNMAEPDSDFNEEILYRVGQLFAAVEANEQEKMETFFAMEELAKVLAWAAFLGQPHDLAGDNLRLFYDTSSGLFWPVARTEGGIEPIQDSEHGIDWHLSTAYEQPVPLLRYFLSNSELRNMRNKEIFKALQDKEELLQYYYELERRYRNAFLLDNTSAWRTSKAAYFMGLSKENLEKNIAGLEKMFAYSKCYINVVREGSGIVIEVMPDSETALRFLDFSLQLDLEPGTEATLRIFDGKGNLVGEETIPKGSPMQLAEQLNRNLIQPLLGEEMQPVKTIFRYEVLFPPEAEFDIESVDVEIENAVTGSELKQEEIYLRIADGTSDYSELWKMTEQGFLEKYKELAFEKQDKELHLLEGGYAIERNLIIPEKLHIVLDAGADLKIAAGKSIVSYSDLDIRGTEEKPVVVSKMQEEPFGVLAVIGNSRDSKTSITQLHISGGSEKFINGVFFSGQLSVYHSDLDMSDSLVEGSASDDGLNVKYGAVSIENSIFQNNSIDQVDLDFCSGTVSNSVFQSEQVNAGDGIDLSGSPVLVKNSRFQGMGDKGISVGEKSWVVVHNSSIVDNNLGAAVKDLSEAFFVRNTISNNNTAISAYQKKALFGGGDFYTYGNTLEGNESIFVLDDKSGQGNIELSGSEWAQFEEAVAENDIAKLQQLLAME